MLRMSKLISFLNIVKERYERFCLSDKSYGACIGICDVCETGQMLRECEELIAEYRWHDFPQEKPYRDCICFVTNKDGKVGCDRWYARAGAWERTPDVIAWVTAREPYTGGNGQ